MNLEIRGGVEALTQNTVGSFYHVILQVDTKLSLSAESTSDEYLFPMRPDAQLNLTAEGVSDCVKSEHQQRRWLSQCTNTHAQQQIKLPNRQHSSHSTHDLLDQHPLCRLYCYPGSTVKFLGIHMLLAWSPS